MWLAAFAVYSARRTRCHQHEEGAAVAADVAVVPSKAHDGVSSEAGCFFGELCDSPLFEPGQLFLVRSGLASHDVPEGGKPATEGTDSACDMGRDKATVGFDGVAFKVICGAKEDISVTHGTLSSTFTSFPSAFLIF